ncbi:MAG: hypothetical protein A3C02_04690 [Candidatus Andersenbacteria bacterium RIFCSPHIGHO2_02_FULL_45_11]|uniref:Transposase IS200-like domain-containing protein n=1 Tax=Candidatus Andersenbacteria bacterium RIFCSPHIGHO2_12_FULL_45_11 TaxID=1797281 RepID=A0A1G1X2U2_9BACT|nr:MAG: hypothetical protein A2805_00280 [Candidatus Andersenbacteria bacterium RIFCSPHIGHO2_01_FULL_46_36]OGY34111.1 MAG: hypothetical protein A3D99_01800 [Candidatus Andersenbacteria bacterium RIFCSPHIGHO2_12_FULL_45_11]OGY34235.1 MAG: hypothetical protein A3C02_04690 [Candidatus Andersenbacteria bacterium RIFCSPHIGHO2_02_FULL_45_11]
MGYRYVDFAPGEIYHIFTRGVEKRKIFLYDADRIRFLSLLIHCLPQGQIQSFSVAQKLKQKSEITSSGEGLVDILSYCLMNNHFHLLLKENIDHGISIYMQRLLTSYAMYFNKRSERSGSLFVHPFKAVLVDADEQFLHVTRYIHLNPFAAHLIKDPFEYRWSSLNECVSRSTNKPTCHPELLGEMIQKKEYREFVLDQADYEQSLDDNYHLLIDIDEDKP